MKKILNKLTSRKFLTAVCGIAVGIAAAFGVDEGDYMQIAGVVTSAVSVASYIFGEAKIDAAKVIAEKNDG